MSPPVVALTARMIAPGVAGASRRGITAGFRLEMASLIAEKTDIACDLLNYVSGTEMRAGLSLIMALSAGLEAELTATSLVSNTSTPIGFRQIW